MSANDRANRSDSRAAGRAAGAAGQQGLNNAAVDEPAPPPAAVEVQANILPDPNAIERAPPSNPPSRGGSNAPSRVGSNAPSRVVSGAPSRVASRNPSRAGTEGDALEIEDEIAEDVLREQQERALGPRLDHVRSLFGRNVRRLSVNSAVTERTTDSERISMGVVNSHPMGAAINLLMEIITGLAVEGRENYEIPSVNEMAAVLPEWPRRSAAEVSAEDLKTKFLEMQFSTASSFMVMVECPEGNDFANRDTLSDTDMARHNFVRSQFSPRAKFSGTAGNENNKKEGSIIELLEHLTRQQRIVRLSRPEFTNKMLEHFTGEAYTSVHHWLNLGYDLQEVYRRLVDRFYRDETPSDARTKLKNLAKDHEFQNLSKLECEITRLAKICSYKYDMGTRRSEAFEMAASETLLDCLPENTKNMLEGKINQIRAISGRYPDFHQIGRLAGQYRDGVDRYLRTRPKKSKDSKDAKDKKQNVAEGKTKAIHSGKTGDQKRNDSGLPDSKKKFQGKKDNRDNKKGYNKNKQYENKERSHGDKSHGNSYHAPSASVHSVTSSYNPPCASVHAVNSAGRNNKPPVPLGGYTCSLCPDTDHGTNNCPHFPPEKRMTVEELCDRCDWNRFHKKAWCPKPRNGAAK